MFPISLNLAVIITDPLGSISANISLNLGKPSSSKSLRVRLFSLSLTVTVFSWFLSLAPNSIRSWDELEQKFHDHFYSGDNETKLMDLTSVRQGRDESIQEYLKKFKDIKNRCFNLSLSEKDLVDLALAGLRSNYRAKLSFKLEL